MKRIISFFLLLSVTPVLYAQQTCTDETIMAVKGRWAKRPDAGMKSGNQSQVTSRIDKMQQLLQAAYPEPMGAEALWYRSMGGYYQALSSNAAAYDLNALFKTYYCNNYVKKLLLGTEASNGFNIWVNKFGWFAEEDKMFLVKDKPVYLLTKKTGEWKGFPLYAGKDNTVANTGQTFSKTILISRPGQLPYVPVSQKDYLLAFLTMKKNGQNKYSEGLLKTPVRTDAEEEVYKQQQLEKIVSRELNEQTKEKARANFLRGYTTARQRRQADIEKSERIYQQDIKAATGYLNNTAPGQLVKPAYVKNTSYAGSFNGFAGENEGLMMVQVNSSYFNNKLPAHVPQFLVVYWQWNTEKPSVDFAAHIENNFDFKKLQVLLDN